MTDETRRDITTTPPQMPARVAPSGGALDPFAQNMIESLPEEHRIALAQKYVEGRIEVDRKAAEAAQRDTECGKDIQKAIEQAREYATLPNDFTLKQHGKSSTGGWSAESKRNSQNLIVIIAAVLGTLALVWMLR